MKNDFKEPFFYLIFFFCFCSIIYLGCGGKNKISGAWIRVEQKSSFEKMSKLKDYPIITFYNNNQFDFHDDRYKILGNYRILNDTLQIWDNICGSFTGNYGFVLEDKDLSIFFISDNCLERRNWIEGYWKWK